MPGTNVCESYHQSKITIKMWIKIKYSHKKNSTGVNKFHNVHLLKIIPCNKCSVFISIKAIINIAKFNGKPEIKNTTEELPVP